MSWRPPGTLGVLALLGRTTLLRHLRAARIAKARTAQKTGKKRQATARKGSDGLLWLLMIVVLPLFFLQAMAMSTNAATNLQYGVKAVHVAGESIMIDRRTAVALNPWTAPGEKAPDRTDAELLTELADAGIDDEARPSRAQILDRFRAQGMDGFTYKQSGHPFRLLARDAAWQSDAARAGYARGGALLLFTLLLALLCLSFGAANTNLAGGSWTASWLMTFPVATRSLVMARFLEYALVQFFPWFTLFPLAWQLLRVLGQPGAAALAAMMTVLTLLFLGSVRLWLENWLRLRCSLHTLRSVQGACTLLGLVFMVGGFGAALALATPRWFVDLGQAMPDAITWLPTAWVTGVPLHGLWPAALAIATTAAIAGLCFTATVRLLSHGSMAGGGVDAGNRDQAGRWRRGRALGVAGKDLSQLLRDRTFLVQTVIAPMLIIGLQLVINPGIDHIGGAGYAMIGYGIGMYTTIGGCTQILGAEGRGLWMLYSLPVTLATAMRRKVRVWALLSIGFGLLALLLFRLRAGELPLDELAIEAAFTAFGIWCAAHLAAAFGILGCNPAADYVPRGIKVRYAYLYFLLASVYFSSLATPEPHARIGGALVFATLVYAVWQRACDRLPYVLDPVDSATPRLSVLDGGIAMLVFFLGQAVTLLILNGGSLRMDNMSVAELLMAFVIGGGVALLLVGLIMRLRQVPLLTQLGLRRPADVSPVRAAGLAILAGTGLGLLGLGYLHLLQHQFAVSLPRTAPGNLATTLLLAVLAAPLIEELLFRGLLFGAMVRSMRPTLAVLWSSTLFATVHPSLSWPPVLLLGITAALVYHRTRWLPAAMLVHAVYNGIVVGFGPG